MTHKTGRAGRRYSRAGRSYSEVDPGGMTTIAYPCGTCGDGSQMYCLQDTETGEEVSGGCASGASPQQFVTKGRRRKRKRSPLKPLKRRVRSFLR